MRTEAPTITISERLIEGETFDSALSRAVNWKLLSVDVYECIPSDRKEYFETTNMLKFSEEGHALVYCEGPGFTLMRDGWKVHQEDADPFKVRPLNDDLSKLLILSESKAIFYNLDASEEGKLLIGGANKLTLLKFNEDIREFWFSSQKQGRQEIRRVNLSGGTDNYNSVKGTFDFVHIICESDDGKHVIWVGKKFPGAKRGKMYLDETPIAEGDLVHIEGVDNSDFSRVFTRVGVLGDKVEILLKGQRIGKFRNFGGIVIDESFDLAIVSAKEGNGYRIYVWASGDKMFKPVDFSEEKPIFEKVPGGITGIVKKGGLRRQISWIVNKQDSSETSS